MLSSAGLSPTARRLPNVPELISRLEEYGRWKSPTKLDFEKILGDDNWHNYWSKWKPLTSSQQCQDFADSCEHISEAIKIKT